MRARDPRSPQDTDGPLVSVLTPSFNQAAWLGDNLRSVACQSYPHIEHVVMDGGSTDGSKELSGAADHRLIWHSEPDEGQADAINKAFEASSGEIIGWINSDDAYFGPDTISAVVDHFAVHPEVDVVYGHCLQTTADGGAIQVLWAPTFDGELLRTLNIISQPATFFRRSAIEPPLLDATFHFTMDYELWLRLESMGRRFARIDRFVAIDRHQPDRKSSTIKDVHDRDLERLAQRYDTRFGPEHEAARRRFYLTQRVAGARLIPRIRPPFAFTAPDRPTAGLLLRQVVTRRSRWPEEYR